MGGRLMEWSSRYFKVALSILITLVCLYLLGQLRGFIYDIWKIIKVLFVPFLAAAVVTYILAPIVDLLTNRRVPRPIAILMIYVAFFLLVAIAVMNAIPVVTRQLMQLIGHLPDFVAKIDAWLDELWRTKANLPDPIRTSIESYLAQLQKNASSYVGGLLNVLSGTISFLFVALTVPFLVFYMLKDGAAIGRAVVSVAPSRHRPKVRRVLLAVDDTFGKYVRGQLLVMLALGILAYAGLLIVRMPYAFLLACFIAITDMIPYFGPFIGAAPCLLLALTISPSMALKVLIVNIIVQQAEGGLISPQIMGKTLDLHPMAIVAALLVGGEVGGILGLLVAVPFLAILKVVWTELKKDITTT
jgi:predicted PurR-regulated permease PerM